MIDPTAFLANFLNAVDFQNAVDVSLDSVLKELPEWDSLAALGVIVMFDMEYSKAITGDDLSKCVTVNDIMKLMD